MVRTDRNPFFPFLISSLTASQDLGREQSLAILPSSLPQRYARDIELLLNHRGQRRCTSIWSATHSPSRGRKNAPLPRPDLILA